MKGFQIDRRTGTIGAVALVAVAALAYAFWPEPAGQTTATTQAPATQGAAGDLMRPGPLPENVTGAKDAPVTIVEYSSMTCPHCARFHTDVLPGLKDRYIETGKVRYIIREFPLDNLAAAASMLARCIDRDRYFTFVDVLYSRQREWAFGEGDAVQRLFNIAKQAGFTEESFNACLSDQALLDGIMEVRNIGQRHGVNSTPTFFVDGKPLRGGASIEEFEKLMPAEVVAKTS